jgi:hypothetical protein
MSILLILKAPFVSFFLAIAPYPEDGHVEFASKDELVDSPVRRGSAAAAAWFCGGGSMVLRRRRKTMWM